MKTLLLASISNLFYPDFRYLFRLAEILAKPVVCLICILVVREAPVFFANYGRDDGTFGTKATLRKDLRGL